MSKEVTLSISERVATAKILNAFKGDLTELSVFLADMKNIAISAEEWEKAELVKTAIKDGEGNLTGQESWNWQDKPELDKAIALEGATVLYIQNSIKASEEKKEITMADAALITLKTKLQ